MKKIIFLLSVLTLVSCKKEKKAVYGLNDVDISQNSANKDIGKPIPKDSKKIVKEEVPIMWDFKLKKTRVILIATIIYSVLFYWFGIYEDVLDELGYWSLMSPVFIYWIAIPLFRWVMKGN